MGKRTSALALIACAVPVVLLAQRFGTAAPPEKILDAIGAREGATICEVGAGDGAMSIAAAKVVGASGRVYTNELGDARIQKLQARAADYPQITVVAGDVSRTNFPDGACDALFMKDVYHHFSDPAAMNVSLAAALKPGGRVAIVDFTPPRDEAPRPEDRDNDGMHGIKPESVARELSEAGFEPVDTVVDGRWFMVVVAKPKHPSV